MHEQNSKHTHHGSEQIKLPISHPSSNPAAPVSPDPHPSLTAQNLLVTQPQGITLKVQDSVTVKQPEPGRGEALLKGAWSLFSVAIVPLVLFWIGHEVEKANEETAQNTRESESLNSYVDSITTLLISRDIDTTDKTKIEKLIRSKSLLVSRQIDGDRKGQVVRFLYDQELIFSDQELGRRSEQFKLKNNPSPEELASFKDSFYIARLGDLDLVNVDLRSAFIPGINLSNTAMRGGVFNDADLSRADLREADLSNANLSNANLSNVDLSGANLSGADLSSATLFGATRGVTLSGAMVGGAVVSDLKLKDAIFTDDTTPQAVCAKYSLLKEGKSTCPTIFPEGVEPSAHSMKLLTDQHH